ncbi:MAG: site-2 protease family protein, partial [Patescibacteria group bacterium]
RIIDPSTISGISAILFIFMQVNIGFFVFNMIPFPPLDGSRLLYAFAPDPLQKIMLQIESLGIMSIFIFMFFLYYFLIDIVVSVNNFLLRLLL